MPGYSWNFPNTKLIRVDAEVLPPSTGAWELPPTPHKEPVFGQRFIPDATPVK
jgi:acetolactate synthase-1/2/3 large subunit